MSKYEVKVKELVKKGLTNNLPGKIVDKIVTDLDFTTTIKVITREGNYVFALKELMNLSDQKELDLNMKAEKDRRKYDASHKAVSDYEDEMERDQRRFEEESQAPEELPAPTKKRPMEIPSHAKKLKK